MPDQAEKLRELVQVTPASVTNPAPGPPMIMVAGGKGGVGATTVAVNLAAALAGRGQRVVAVDAARGHADMAHVAGVRPMSGRTLADVMAGKCTATDALAPGPAGTLLLANHWAPKTTPEYSRQMQQRLLAELRTLDELADTIVVDAGSGLTPWSRRFWLQSRVVVMVTTGDDMSVMDAYAAIKLAVRDAAASQVCVLANQCDSEQTAGDIQRRLATACMRFLGRTVLALPSLPQHAADDFADVGPAPRVWELPDSTFGHAVLWLGRAVDELLASNGSSELSGVSVTGNFCTAAASCEPDAKRAAA